MRQAGRYMPEYRVIRERHGILDIIRTPELAAEVTMQPVRAFGLDAAIIFAERIRRREIAAVARVTRKLPVFIGVLRSARKESHSLRQPSLDSSEGCPP